MSKFTMPIGEAFDGHEHNLAFSVRRRIRGQRGHEDGQAFWLNFTLAVAFILALASLIGAFVVR